MPAIQSIGLASDGALKQDTIDKLKSADEKAQIEPIQRRITETKEQNTQLSTLLVSLAGVKGAQNPLSKDIEYQKVSTRNIGDSVNPVVSSGVSPQSIKISVKKLATKDIIESNNFKTRDDILSEQNTTFSISVNNIAYDIDIVGSEDATKEKLATKFKDLPTLISEATSSRVTGSILETGGDKPFKLIIQSRDVGKKNEIFIGTKIKGSKAIDDKIFLETIYKKDDLTINEIVIFTKISNTKTVGKRIDFKGDFPFNFNSSDLFINNIDIFSNTKKTITQSLDKLVITGEDARNEDLVLNGINIFDTADFSELKSKNKINTLAFPLRLPIKSLVINDVDILDTLEKTNITTPILQDSAVQGDYSHNALIINGVSIFNTGDATSISTVSDLASAINNKVDSTNITAELTDLGRGNFRIKLINDVQGDDIDISSSNPIDLAKFRLYTGRTKGNNDVYIENKFKLLDFINEKTSETKVVAEEDENGYLYLHNEAKGQRIRIKSQDDTFLKEIGVEKGTYRDSIPQVISSLDDLVIAINKKSDDHNLIASIKDSKLVLEQTKFGENIEIKGDVDFLTKLKLIAQIIEPDKGRLISTKEDLIEAINSSSSLTSVEASIDKDKITLLSTKNDTDISIGGSGTSLTLLGLSEGITNAINGEIFEGTSTLLDRINEQTEETNVKAFLDDDNKISLLNLNGGSIALDGDEDQLNTLGLSIDSSIKLKNENNNKDLFEKLGLSKAENKLQNAEDSIFKYNGVDIIRDSNKVSDIIQGIDFILEKVDSDTSFTQINIERDKEVISKSFFDFVTAYNSFIRKVSDLTKFEQNETDATKSEAGVFQGKNTITSLPFKLSSILGKIIPSADISSLISLGITLGRDGTLSYKEDEIKNKIKTEFQEVEDLFRGHSKTLSTGKEENVDGIFKLLNDKIKDLTIGDKSTLEVFKTSIEQETDRLSDSLKRTQETLDKRYEQLQQSFIANDAAIGRANNRFAALKTQIAYETAKN